MSTKKTPTDKRWIQSNNGDYGGNLWETWNMDFDTEPGVAKNSKKLTPILTDDFGGDAVQAITVYKGNYHVITTNEVFKCDTDDDASDGSNWTEISTLSLEDLGVETDAVVLENLLLMSLGTNIMSWNGTTKDEDWWTAVTSGSALTSLKTHTLEVLRSGRDTLFVTDGNVVRYYNSNAGHTVLTLEAQFTAHVLIPALDKMWVGTYTESEERAFVYEIQVGNDIPNQGYPVDGIAVLSGFTHRNTPFVITEKGYIQAFNGAGFETVAQFPFALNGGYPNGTRPGVVQDSPTARPIHPKGCKVKGKYAYILVDLSNESDVSQQLDTNSHSGVWVLDLETYSLTHRYAISLTTDKGNTKIESTGPIYLPQTTDTNIMVGSEIGTASGLWVESDETSFGHLTLSRHEADSIADVFETFVTKADTLASGSEIQIAERHTERDTRVVEGIRWLNSTEFVTTDALTDVEVGNEVFVYDGVSAGYHGYITSIATGTSNVVTLDSDMNTSENDISSLYISNFQKFGEVMDIGEWKKNGGIDGANTFAQYRLHFTGNVTLRETISKSNNAEGL